MKAICVVLCLAHAVTAWGNGYGSVHNQQGCLALNRRNPHQAKIEYQKALDENPDDPLAHFGMGTALFFEFIEEPGALVDLINSYRTPETACLSPRRVNFQPVGTPPLGFEADHGLPIGRNATHGWLADQTAAVFRHNVNPDPLLDTGMTFHHDATWRAVLRPGRYEVLLSLGEPGQLRTPQYVSFHTATPRRTTARMTEEIAAETAFIGGGEPMGWHGDDEYWTYELPFNLPLFGDSGYPQPFYFYGIETTEIQISSNGYILVNSYPYADPPVDPAVADDLYLHAGIFPFGSDLKTDADGCDIFIHRPAQDRVAIRWQAVTKHGNIPVNVEAVLYSSGDIQFNYGDCGTATGLIGLSGYDPGGASGRHLFSVKSGVQVSYAQSSHFTCVPTEIDRLLVGDFYEREELHEFIGGGTPMGWHSDDELWQLELPWPFHFYGQDYDNIRVSPQGFAQFSGARETPRNDTRLAHWPMDLVDDVRISVFGNDDMTTDYEDCDVFVHQPDPDRFAIRWYASLGGDRFVNCELILHREGWMRFNYGECYSSAEALVGISAGDRYRFIVSERSETNLNGADSLVYAPPGIGDHALFRRDFHTSNGVIDIRFEGGYSPVSPNFVVLRALDNVTTWPQEIPLDAPPISTIQQVIDQDVMPKIEEVLDHVRAIEQHPEFHKPITAITGYGFVGILTTVEIHALDAMLLALRAALDVVNGYHLDVDYEAIQAPHFDAQDYLDSVNTTFLTHKPDILTRMASAKQDLGDASAHLRSAVAAWKDNAEGFVAAFFEQSGGPVLQDYLTRWMDVLDAALAGPVDVPVNVFNPDDGVVFRGDLAAVAADPPQRTDLPQFHVSNPAEEDWQNVVTEMTFQDPTFNAALPLMTDGEFSGFVSRELVTYLHELFKGGQFGFIMKLLRLDIGVGLVITTCDWERAGIRIEWEPVDAFDGLLDGFIRYEVFRSTASPCDRNRSAAEWNNGLTLVATVTDINTMTALDQTVAQNGAKYHYKVYAVLDNGVIIRSDQRTVLTDDYIGRNWHVDDSNRSGIEDGTARYPFTSLLRALNNAGSGDVVKVAAGTYRDMAGATGKIVYLQGGYAGAPSYNGATEGDFSETARSLDRVQNATVLDGEGLHRLLTFGKDVMGGGGAGGAVSGFIVRDCWENRSGALNCEEETDLLVHHCTFVNNGINDGGGAIACDDETTLTVEDCSFENNGGGIRCDDDCTVTLRRCRFDTTYGSAAVKLYEGGELTAVDCLFTHCNTVGNDDGAAATSFWETAMAFDGCTFTANRADSGGAVAPGYLGTLVATNCLFAGNRAEGRGGALAVDRADVTVRNCTFAENRAPSAGAVYFKVGSMVLADSILWGNRARSLAVSQVSSESFALTISHCLIEGGTQTITCTDGGGNADLDPHFARLGVWIDVDRWTAGDYHLLSAEGRYRPALGLPPADPSAWTADEWTSPAIDAASPAADVRNEPQENGGRANAGRFGTTEQASKSRLQLPSRVTGVEASKGAFPTHVHIHWDGAAGADSYEIYRHETDDHRAATRIGTTPNPEFDDGNALPGTIYLYWIAAVNTAGRAIHSRSSVGFAGALGSGMMLSTGDNWAYQLGDGSREERHRPVPIRDLLGFVQVAADESATIALAGDGSVWVWGTNSKGQFANENLDSSAIPVRVQGLSGIRAIAARSGQCLALTQTGTVLGWGLFLADTGGRAEILHAPTPVPGLTDVVGIAAGNAQALAVKQNGTVWGWGGNGSGEVGMDPQTVWYVTAPTQIPNVADIQAVSAGRAFSLALTRTGTVLAWGRNSDQELGDGTSADRWQPAPVNGLADIVRISAGATHSLALTGSRTVWAWGNNRGGQLGLGAASLPRQPTLIPALSDVADISAGTGINWYDGFSAAVKRDGTVWAWGRNTYGQLGNNSSAHTAAPVQMDVARNAYHVSAGTSHTVVLTAPVFFVNDADTTGDRFCTAPGNPANNGLSAATPKASLAGLLAGIIPPPGAVVRVDTGTYVLDSPVLFSALNSGEAGSDVQIRGAGRAYSIFIPGTGRGPDSAVRLDACHDIYIAGIGFAAFPSAVAGNAGSGVTVSACAMLNCTGNAVDIEGAGELRLIGNRIADGAGAGIVLRNCAEALVASNIAANTAQPGLDILEGNARIVGNSFVDNGVANIRTTGKIHQAGNIFSQTGSGNWCVFVPDPADLLSSDYNLFNPSDGALLGRHAGPRIDLAAWQTSTAGDEHSVQADPMFAAPAEGDWTLQSYSPCIDASLGLPADAPRDADGNPRYDDEHVPNTGAGTPAFVDIGALERQNNSGEIFRVDGSARPGGDGKTWKTAFQTIEDAILAAQDGDSLWIAHWPMHEKLPVSKALRLYGGFEGGETAASERKLWRRRTIVIGPATAEGAVVAVNNAGNVLLDGFLLTALHNTDRRDDANGLFVANGTGMTTVRNCTIVSCFAESGGGVRCIDSDLRVENCEIVGNAALTGGGVSCEGSSTVLLLNCTLSGNTAQTGGGIAAREGAVDLVNSIVYANSAATSGPEIDVGTAAVSVHYSCVGDAAYCSREGNICASPGFRLLGQWVDPGTPADPFDDTWTQGVYHLARNSPCIDAADATAAAAQDLNGMPRFDDPETPNTGLPRAAFSDMGAHEYQGYSNLQLHAGWNLVALRRQPVPDSPTLTFADYSTRNAVFSGRVWAWNGMMQNYRHVVNVDPLCGLWLFCEADVTIQIYGRDIGDDTEPQLGRNWELPGFARPTELLEIPGMRGPGWGWDPVGQQYMPETRTCQPCAAYWILCR